MKQLNDTYGRVHNYLRVSLTDACNLHCVYCAPAEQRKNFLRANVLTDEELITLITFFVRELRIEKIRLTGGEPFARKNIMKLMAQLADLKQQTGFHLGITTNGTLLAPHLKELKTFGVDSLNISLDSLERENFRTITKQDSLQKVLDAVFEAQRLGFPLIKINMVVMRGVNDHELLNFAQFALTHHLNVRFIEFMPFTDNDWSNNKFISYKEMITVLQSRYSLIPLHGDKNAVSKDFMIEGTNGTVSFISSMSEHFCDGCSRLRLTADGKMKICLFSLPQHDLDLKKLLRSHSSPQQFEEAIRAALKLKWKQHPEPEILAEMKNHSMLAIGG
ncbi:MAG: GTP 3',8-cyclase MoaA [Bacteroidetes bacterium]|nr:GTP 3',8-cyclase MoaA [Bacteroidota bacterium]